MASLTGLGNLPENLGSLSAGYAAYWLSLPKTGGVPFKRALDPAAMRNFVASFVIVERLDRQCFTWRLMGSAVRDLTGQELTGKDAFLFHDEVQREKTRRAYNAQLDMPCGAWGIMILRSASGREIPIEVLALPLRDDGGATRFLANTIELQSAMSLIGISDPLTLRFLSWPKHRFIDIGFGLPRLGRGAG